MLGYTELLFSNINGKHEIKIISVVYVGHYCSGIARTMDNLEVVPDPGYEVILEGTLDDLVEDVE